jgi:hypothetical protein
MRWGILFSGLGFVCFSSAPLTPRGKWEMGQGSCGSFFAIYFTAALEEDCGLRDTDRNTDNVGVQKGL